MDQLDKYRRQARAARRESARLAEILARHRNLLRHKQEQLSRARRLGDAGREAEQALLLEIKALQGEIEKAKGSARSLKSTATRVLEAPAAQPQPWEMVAGLNDRLPFLLLPVRIETRFMTVADRKELWVRIFPDDIAVHAHEKNLTGDEVEAGKTYWRENWRARHGPAKNRQSIEKGAWRVLAQAYGGTRASWIARQTRPVTLNTPTVEELQFPEFPPETLKAESWSLAPRSNVMPDRFVVMGFSHGKEVFRKAGNPIPDPLIVGPDPQAEEAEFRQEGGKLLVGADFAWIYDFQQAVQVGMGVQIELEPPFDVQGLSRLLVLGLRLSANEKETQAAVEDLFENHRYSQDGFSLVPQGTPTNNADHQGSGFSSADPGAENSFNLETSGSLFKPVDHPLEKCDGQRLVEALGIRQALFQRVQNAGRTDARDALIMNRALWSGTLGYYLEEMLDLSLPRIEDVRSFFIENVTGRGSLPAVRVGSQPYGLLLTSDFSRWKWSPELDAGVLPGLEDLYAEMSKLEKTMASLVSQAARIGAPGDPFQNLLNTLGLQASSVEFYRRHAVGLEYLWNYEVFSPGTFQGKMLLDNLAETARSRADEIEINSPVLPSIFRLSFFQRQDQIRDPVVDDIPAEEIEKVSETKTLRRIYRVPDPENPDASIETNYISWLVFSPYQTLRAQNFENLAGETQPVPRPLLYRMLRASLLQAIYDAALRLYVHAKLVPPLVRREVELSNIQLSRTVTRWEFIDADISELMPQVSRKSQPVAEFLLSAQGLVRPESAVLRETIESIRALAELDLSTAQLERTFAEHIDLCSYRLDAWQTGCFHRRLQQQRFPAQSQGAFAKRVLGLYLGAFGWLEDVRPGPEPVPADMSSIPGALHNPNQDGPLFTQLGNAGFIHAPSLHHAVTAAVLRSAYLTHFDQNHPEKMAISLSSERVRTALAFLEGVRNGQELGTLLGYQFERGLHDGYGDPSLNQFIPNFRQKYPLVADKITQAPDSEQMETQEARNVFDGYALLEVAVLRDSPLPYPYGIQGLPAANSVQANAIRSEVARMADSLDAIADLSLAEGVYQVAQGNFDRSGAMLKAMTQGESPAEPEIVRTPRSGAAVTQRVTLHLQTGNIPSPWPSATSRRAAVEPGLNAWLGELLPHPTHIQFVVRLGGGDPVEQNLTSLGVQPIDLLYLIGDDLLGETTELESRIAFQNRRKAKDDSLEVTFDFTAEPGSPQAVNLFELLPLLRALRQLITSSRPLSAGDYVLPSEANTNPAEDANPHGIALAALSSRVQAALTAFAAAVQGLASTIPPLGADGQPQPNLANAENLRAALRTLSDFGVPDAFPHSAFGSSAQAKATLTSQAVNIHASTSRALASAQASKVAGDDTTLIAQERAARYRSAAQAIFGSSFNLIPSFHFKNREELQAAATFRDAAPPDNLTRHYQDNPLIGEEWLQGAARVQPGLATLETITILGENFGNPRTQLKPLQLPFRKTDHWVAVEYPETFLPEGEYLSIFQVLPASGFQPTALQSGLLVDEWVEVIPSKAETTGIAFHFNQPNSEPPQVCLLAVTPGITGNWTWDKLVGILQDTFERAQRRAVEPDHLGQTAYGHLLPAILTPVASRPFATIATDLVYETAIRFPRDFH